MGTQINTLINPDLQTREAVQLAGGRVQFAVRVPEDELVRYVRFDAKRRNPEGSDKRYSQVPFAEATHVFISEKGYGTPSIGTYYPPKGKYTEGRVFLADGRNPGDPHVDAITAVIDHVSGQPTSAKVDAEDRCGICGRKLTDPVSIERGIGPECASKPTGTKILHASKFGQQKLDVEPKVTQWEQVEGQEATYKQITDAEAAHKQQHAKVEQIQERIAFLQKQEVEVEGQLAAVRKDISLEQEHLAELLEAAQA